MAEYDIPFGRPWIEDVDRQAVLSVLEGHILTHGPNCSQFEADFSEMMGAGHSVSTSSCMASLHLSSIHLGLGEGDEVIVPAQTHVATIHAVELTGARPVFVDCDPLTGNITAAAIEAAITPRTKAVSLVHFVGIPADMDEICAVVEQYNLKLIEDCAIAIGARYNGRHVGLFGHTGCYSFYPVKHITTGEGGMLVSQHEEVAQEIASFRAFNVDRKHNERKIPGLYDVKGVGMNYRMSEMQAALGVTQVQKIPAILAKRAENFAQLKADLLEMGSVRVLDAQTPKAQNSHYCLVAVLEGELAARRDEMILKFKDLGVGTSVYYPHPIPRFKYYQDKYGEDVSAYPNALEISDCSIALPVGPHLALEDMKAVAESFAKVVKSL